VNAADGAHKLKARWTSGDGLLLEIVANFTVGEPTDPPDPPELPEAVPAKVQVPPGPALMRLWSTADNRRPSAPQTAPSPATSNPSSPSDRRLEQIRPRKSLGPPQEVLVRCPGFKSAGAQQSPKKALPKSQRDELLES
jgi:hypothetical protein